LEFICFHKFCAFEKEFRHAFPNDAIPYTTCFWSVSGHGNCIPYGDDIKMGICVGDKTTFDSSGTSIGIWSKCLQLQVIEDLFVQVDDVSLVCKKTGTKYLFISMTFYTSLTSINLDLIIWPDTTNFQLQSEAIFVLFHWSLFLMSYGGLFHHIWASWLNWHYWKSPSIY
jgi:hypothetical protein